MIIAVDGNVYAGKTTLVRQLSTKLGWPIVDEQNAFLPPAVSDRLFSWSHEHQRYVEAEGRRAERFCQRSLVVDRSFLSLAAHATVLHQLGLADLRVEFLESFLQLWLSHRVLIPAIVVWADCPYEDIIKRAAQDPNRGTDPLFLSRAYVDRYAHWFCSLFEKAPLFSVSISAGAEKLEQTMQAAITEKLQVNTVDWPEIVAQHVSGDHQRSSFNT